MNAGQQKQAVARTIAYLGGYGRRGAPRNGRRPGSAVSIHPETTTLPPSREVRPLSPIESAKKEQLDIDLFENRLIFDMSM